MPCLHRWYICFDKLKLLTLDHCIALLNDVNTYNSCQPLDCPCILVRDSLWG